MAVAASEGVEGHTELDVHPLAQGRVRELHEAPHEGGIHLGRFRERHGRAGEGVFPQHGLEAGHEGDLRVAHAILGQAHAVPGVGPGGLQVDGPLKFGGRVVVVRLAAELANPQ